MSLRRTIMLAALISMAPTAMVIGQTTSPSDTSPSSASSPSQRDATSSSSTEAPATNDSTSPAAASTPHQQQAVKGTHTASKQSMKDCMAKQQADNSGMSAADAKKACKAQMKANSG